jgi:hypothetical protein
MRKLLRLRLGRVSRASYGYRRIHSPDQAGGIVANAKAQQVVSGFQSQRLIAGKEFLHHQLILLRFQRGGEILCLDVAGGKAFAVEYLYGTIHAGMLQAVILQIKLKACASTPKLITSLLAVFSEGMMSADLNGSPVAMGVSRLSA